MFISDAPSLIALNGGARLRDSAVRLQHYLDVNPGNKARAVDFWQDQKALTSKDSGHPADGLFIGTGVRDIRTDCYTVLSAVRMGTAADKALYEGFCDFFVAANSPAAPLNFTLDLAPTLSLQPDSQISLAVPVAGGEAPYTYRWKRDGNAIGSNKNTYGPTSPTAGTYTCTVTDSVGVVVTSTACVVSIL